MKDIPGYEGKYAVTEDGRLWSYPNSQHSGRFLKLQKHNGGYQHTILLGKLFLVHRLVAMTYLPNKKDLPQVNHINGVKTDNRVENLEWCTNSENLFHSVKIGTYNHSRIDSDNYFKKIKREDIKEILHLCSEGLTHQQIADTFNISRSYVQYLSKKDVVITGPS
jgi:YesN/AraC family two-component response regulator